MTNIDRDACETADYLVGKDFEFSGRELNDPLKEYHRQVSFIFLAMLAVGGVRYFWPSVDLMPAIFSWCSSSAWQSLVC